MNIFSKKLGLYFGSLIFSSISLTYAEELKIHVIEPRYRIDWSSPRNLAITSGADSAGDDYAPIGHFAVEINCARPNKYGIRHVLTGMERLNKDLSRKITLKKKLGLGSLVYPFQGALQSSRSSLQEMAMATRDGRMKTIIIPTSSARCDQMLDFIDNWIESGSYQVYGGGKNVSQGEGAGCADFAMELFKLASGNSPFHEWMVSINIPKYLMGNGKNKQVEFSSLLARAHWAQKNEPSMHFEIADTNYVFDWLVKKSKPQNTQYQYIKHLFPTGLFYSGELEHQKYVKEAAQKMHAPAPLKPFKFRYEKNISDAKMWKAIRLN